MRAILFLSSALTALGLVTQSLATVPAAKNKTADKAANPFDPLKLLETPPAPPEKEAPDRLKERAIYRIEGVRFQKFVSVHGTVFIESPSAVPDFERGRVLCPGQMNPNWEVIRIRDEVEMSTDVARHEKAILDRIGKCGK